MVDASSILLKRDLSLKAMIKDMAFHIKGRMRASLEDKRDLEKR
jgi:hypothetical protein